MRWIAGFSCDAAEEIHVITHSRVKIPLCDRTARTAVSNQEGGGEGGGRGGKKEAEGGRDTQRERERSIRT